MKCRLYRVEDYQFLREMLYEAVFWSRTVDKPSLEEGLSYDYTKHILKNFGKRTGDIAVVAESDSVKAGAAFVRYWNSEVNTRGYISDDIPVLVIAVDEKFRNKGVGSLLMEAIKEAVVEKGINEISLCVTKSNHAYKLYQNQGFEIYRDIDESYDMIWKK